MRYVDVSEDDKRDAIATVFGTVAPLPTVRPKLVSVAHVAPEGEDYDQVVEIFGDPIGT